MATLPILTGIALFTVSPNLCLSVIDWGAWGISRVAYGSYWIIWGRQRAHEEQKELIKSILIEELERRENEKQCSFSSKNVA